MNAWGGAWGISWGASWDIVVPTVYGAIPAGAVSAERSQRRPTVSAIRSPLISMSQRNNEQSARRRN